MKFKLPFTLFSLVVFVLSINTSYAYQKIICDDKDLEISFDQTSFTIKRSNYNDKKLRISGRITHFSYVDKMVNLGLERDSSYSFILIPKEVFGRNVWSFRGYYSFKNRGVKARYIDLRCYSKIINQ